MKTLNKEEKLQTVGTWLPVFSGFYGTIWESDRDEENELYEINRQRQEKGKPEISWDDVKWNYKEYQQDVVKGITHHIESDLKALGLVSEIVFQELRSPREYNFHNDSINVEIKLTKSNVINIGKYLKENLTEFESYLKDKYTSYDGFFSSYSNDLDAWMFDLGDTLAHDHKLGSVLNFILLNDNGEDYEESIRETLSGNGVTMQALNYDELIGGQ